MVVDKIMGLYSILFVLSVCFTNFVKADEDGLDKAAIIRITFGAVSFIVIVVCGIVFLYCYKKKKKQAQVRANHANVPIGSTSVAYVPNQPPLPPAYGQHQPPPAYGQYSTPPAYGQKSDNYPPAYPPPPANY